MPRSPELLPSRPSSDRGSGIRLTVGFLLFFGSLLIAILGFVRLVGVLDRGGYGTPPMRDALLILGAAGAGLAGGLATLIWDIAKRFER
jgi:hypothetical protein